MSLQADVFLRVLDTKENEKYGEMMQGALQNNMVKIQLAVGEVLTCQEMRRALTFESERLERQREFEEQRRRERLLRQQQRELARLRAKTEAEAA